MAAGQEALADMSRQHAEQLACLKKETSMALALASQPRSPAAADAHAARQQRRVAESAQACAAEAVEVAEEAAAGAARAELHFARDVTEVRAECARLRESLEESQLLLQAQWERPGEPDERRDREEQTAAALEQMQRETGPCARASSPPACFSCVL